LADGDSRTTLASLGIRGTLELKEFAHFDETPNENRHLRSEGIAELSWRRRLSPWSDVRLTGEARGDDDELADGVHFQIPETTRRRSILNVKDAVMRLHTPHVEFTLGKQVFAWGTADAVNPTDSINPYDYLDVLDRYKIGVWSAAFTQTYGPLSHTLVIVPVFTPSRDPLLRSRWAPRTPPGLLAVVDDRELPDDGLNTVQFATRLKATIRGWDASISYYNGFDNTPVLRRSSVAIAPFLVIPRFTPVYTKLQAYGFDVSTTFGKLEVHGEGAFRLVESRGRDDRFQWVAGINYSFDELPVKWLERIELVAEYARETRLHTRRNSPFERSEGFFSSAFRNAMAARARFKFNEETQFVASGTMNLESEPNGYVQLKVSHKITDALHVEGALDLLAGPRASFWGRWRDNDRFVLMVKFFF
jgi:hypothetical protein